ncbi:hypothetical protein [Rhizobium halophytocola]|uniref:Uncharacterized protein n=1 Tax=Rhizobium halophytocola TaxID=735519 RepID=A0ABS4DYQ3_9HYPH|nr:hypothetical protein [Rhizobium halophytocola]MBP1850822.1 hypothetical protein [Rhizobium halophytocola]
MTSISTLLDSSYSTLRMLDADGAGIIDAEATPVENGPTRTQDPTVSSENAATGVASQLSARFVAGILDGISGSDLMPSSSGWPAAAALSQAGADQVSAALGEVARPLSAIISEYVSYGSDGEDDDTAAA